MKKPKSKNLFAKQWVPVAAVVIILFVLVAAAALMQPRSDYGTIEEKIKADIEAAKLKTARPDYLPAVVYSNLPPFPRDFYQVDILFSLGRLTDFVDLEEAYYKQPEFYPLFEENIDAMRNPDISRVVAFGYGAYPGDILVEASAEDEFTVVTFFHSSWRVETYQGMKMQAVYPNNANVPTPDLTGVNFTVVQDPDKVRNYFEVGFDPEVFLLEPSFPIFGSNWAQKVLVHVKIKEDAPKGRYVVGVNPTSPPKEFSSEMTRKYLLSYADASAGVAGRPFVQIIVDVV